MMRERSRRSQLSLLLLIVDIAVLVMTIADIHGPIRFVFGLVLGTVIPGWSVVGLLQLDNAAVEVALSISVSLSMLMVIGEFLMFIHQWHLTALEIIVTVLCAPALAWLAIGTTPKRRKLRS